MTRKTRRNIINKRKTNKKRGGQPFTPGVKHPVPTTISPTNIPQPNNNIATVAVDLLGEFDSVADQNQSGGRYKKYKNRKTNKKRGGQPSTPGVKHPVPTTITPNNIPLSNNNNNNPTVATNLLDEFNSVADENQSGGRYKKNKSRKNKLELKKEFIAHTFLEMLDTIKLYHWKTNSYSHHKSTDELHERLQHKTDKFIEIMLGKSKTRINNIDKHIKLYNLNNKNFNDKLYKYRTLLIEMDNYLDHKKDTDLMNIRDEMIGEINHYLYKSTFK